METFSMDIAKEIVRKAETYRGYTAGNLSEIVSIPSTDGQEEACILKIKEMLEGSNVDDMWIDGFGSLIARIGNGERKLAIDAHIDTVDTGDLSQWELDPFSGKIDGHFVHGRGTVDQKGAAASMITAVRILKELAYDGNASVFFTFTIMEEDCEGLCWNYLIENEKLVPEYAVITEPSNLCISRGQRGRLEIDLDFKGRSAHASAPERGDNAIYRCSHVIQKIEELNKRLREDEFLGRGSVAATQVSSESPSLCAIPDRCRLHLDRRLTYGETKESVLKEIERITAGDAEISVPVYTKKSYRGMSLTQEKYFPPWVVPGGHPLIEAGVKTYELLFGESPDVGKWVFSTNGVSICGRYGIPAMGFGPGDEFYAHVPNERIPIDHLVKASAFYALFPYICCPG
jgi:putative selenium metabolism hydrolase